MSSDTMDRVKGNGFEGVVYDDGVKEISDIVTVTRGSSGLQGKTSAMT